MSTDLTPLQTEVLLRDGAAFAVSVTNNPKIVDFLY